MAFELCTHCKKTVSPKAEYCPHCGHPQRTKNCIACDAKIGTRRKKCPECNAYQYPQKSQQVEAPLHIPQDPILKTTSGETHSPVPQKEKTNKPVIILFLVIAIGLTGYYTYDLGFWDSMSFSSHSNNIPDGMYMRRKEASEGKLGRQILEGIAKAGKCPLIYRGLGRRVYISGDFLETKALLKNLSYEIYPVQNSSDYYEIYLTSLDGYGQERITFSYTNGMLLFQCAGFGEVVYDRY